MKLYQLDLSKDIVCVMAGRNHRITAKEGTKPHRLSHNLFLFVISGKVEFVIENNRVQVEKGSVLIIPKDHEYSLFSKEGVDFLFLHFTGDLEPCSRFPNYYYYSEMKLFYLQPIESRLICIPEVQNLGTRYGEFFSRISNCIAHTAGATYSAQLMLNIEFQRVLIMLNEINETRVKDENLPPVLSKIVVYIRKNQNTVPTVKDISKEFALSPSYIARLFKTHLNVTPTAFIIREKMTYARSLIQYGDMNISEIASYLGYNDIYYFSRLYKKTFGQSPIKDRVNG